MKHLKLFETESEYNSFKGGSDFVLPNVSYIKGSNLYYNPLIESTGSYVAVDLGLPSGRLWADRNIGAESPEAYGLYFQWGDTVGYTVDQVTNGEKAFSSDWSDYFDTTNGGSTFNKYNINGGLKTLEASDDAASVNMGSDWRMPTHDEMQELIDNTTLTFIDLQGNEFSKNEAGTIEEYNLKGVRFTGSNGNSIFIPASGHCTDSALSNVGLYGTLWLSDLYSDYNSSAWYLFFVYEGFITAGDNYRNIGQPVRAVR